MPSFQKTATGWRAQVDVRGQRASITLPTKREVQDWAAKKELEFRSAVHGDMGHGKTLRDALRKYADEVSPKNRGEKWEVIRLKAYESPEHALPIGKAIAKVTDDDLRQWRDRRLKVTARGSVLRDMTLMRSVFEQARTEWKWIKVNPINEVKKPSRPEHRKRTITPIETRKVLQTLGYTRKPVRTVSQSVAVAFLLALATGMRAGEICSLRWADVRDSYGTVHNVKAKERGVSRDVPFSRVAVRLLERMKGWDDDRVFGLTAATLDALFRRARVKAGLEGFTFHDSRHTAATRMAGQLHILELCKAFGWVNTSQAMTYFNPKAGDIAAKLR